MRECVVHFGNGRLCAQAEIRRTHDVKFRLSQINLFREENRLFGKPGRVPKHEKRQNGTDTNMAEYLRG